MTSGAKPIEIHDEAELIAQLGSNVGSDNFVATTLKTDERVIARVTDGIYRQPGSALRELIVNAYDADATRVVVNTDAPRFERISVEDDGHGMNPSVLAHLLFHIGGSAKRNEDGRSLGITDGNDSSLSPRGRHLIGKIGIGLFSVSQLTHAFQVITKVNGDPYRTIATIVLRQYQDEVDSTVDGGDHKFESGKVNIWREPAQDIESHGTTIILTNIRRQARDTLRSREIWNAIDLEEHETQGQASSIDPPKFHIGRVDSSGSILMDDEPFGSLPWDSESTPDEAFRHLVDAVWHDTGDSSPNPKLDRIFDYYLRMVWQISLAVPLPYVEGHLFDTSLTEWAQGFRLSNSQRGKAESIDDNDNRPIRKIMEFNEESEPPCGFEVLFDGLKLYRPIKYKALPRTASAIKNPLVFLGKCREDFASIPIELSGGTLAFEAYLFWNSKIVPTEHQGVLIRIHGASGTLFDPSFLRYQVSEQTRLRQVTCEIFIREGLDSALNIDRESFNNAHPHSVYITKWLHSALRQLASAQKKVASDLRSRSRGEQTKKTRTAIQQIASEVWSDEEGEYSDEMPSIHLVDSNGDKRTPADSYVFKRSSIVPSDQPQSGAKQRQKYVVLDEKIKAVAQILLSFGLLDSLPKKKQEKLLRSIYKVMDMDE